MPKTTRTPHRHRQKPAKVTTDETKAKDETKSDGTVTIYIDRRYQFGDEKKYIIISDVIFDGGSLFPYRPSLMDHGTFPSEFYMSDSIESRLLQAKVINICGESDECHAGAFASDVTDEISYPFRLKEEKEATVIMELMTPKECADALGEDDVNAPDVVALFTNDAKLTAITDAIAAGVQYASNIQYSYWLQLQTNEGLEDDETNEGLEDDETNEGLEDDDDKHCAAIGV